MTQTEVAAEIYAHALIYFSVNSIPLNNIVTRAFVNTIGNKLAKRTGTVDLESGGDKRTGFKAAYCESVPDTMKSSLWCQVPLSILLRVRAGW